MNNLERVAFTDCTLTRRDICPLSELEKLKELDLRRTNFCDNMLPSLKGFRHLRNLNLSGTLITDNSLKGLVALPGLQRLDLTGTAVTGPSLDQIRKECPHLEVLSGKRPTSRIHRLFTEREELTLGKVRMRPIPDWELLVVDDASTDDSLATITAWAEKDANPRVPLR